MKFLRWIAKQFKDLFYGPDNQALELGRVLAFGATSLMFLGALWNVLLGLPLELGPNGLGGGLGLVLGGAGALIYAKDRAKSERTVANAVSDATPVAPATPAVAAAKAASRE